MYVELSQQSQEYIAEQLAQGKFSSETELLEAAVHQLRLADWMDAFCDTNETEILKKLHEALASLDRGEGIPAQEIFDELRALGLRNVATQ